MRKIWERWHREQRGITGLETAIILIAFVVVASVFAYVVLSAGFLAADQAKGTIIDGLDKVSASVEIRGSVIALDKGVDITADGANDIGATDTRVDVIKFVIASAVTGKSLDITPPTDANNNGVPDSGSSHRTVISYWDKYQKVNDLVWSTQRLTDYTDGNDNVISIGEEVVVTVHLAYNTTPNYILTTPLVSNTEFVIEVKPPQGGVLVIERRTSASILQVNDLQ